jgi:hypothetical protein
MLLQKERGTELALLAIAAIVESIAAADNSPALGIKEILDVLGAAVSNMADPDDPGAPAAAAGPRLKQSEAVLDAGLRVSKGALALLDRRRESGDLQDLLSTGGAAALRMPLGFVLSVLLAVAKAGEALSSRMREEAVRCTALLFKAVGGERQVLLCPTRVDCQTVLSLTYCVCGTHPSNLRRE